MRASDSIGITAKKANLSYGESVRINSAESSVSCSGPDISHLSAISHASGQRWKINSSSSLGSGMASGEKCLIRVKMDSRVAKPWVSELGRWMIGGRAEEG
jgi:hypothetical protein